MLKKYFGPLVAPWMYTLARATNNKRLADAALEVDPYNLRPLNILGLPAQQNDVVAALRHASLLAARTSTADASKILRLVAHSRSQLRQDVIGLLAAGEKRGGYFVEVGVGDGESLSNTFLMEQSYDWNGLLCEPNRKFQETIVKRRKAKLERRAIYRKTGERLDFLADENLGELSRLVSAEGGDFHKRSGEVYTVTTVTLDEALLEAGAPRDIDFVSIDTEGSELAVLEGFDLSKWNVGMLVLEHNFDVQRRKKYAEVLVPQGYVSILSPVSGFDDWYVHRDYAPGFLNGLKH
jgi:FkbM family methyltransferase